MQSSYQHSPPAVLNVDDGAPLHYEYEQQSGRRLPWKLAVMLAGIFVGSLALLNSNHNGPRASFLAASMSEGGPPNPEQYDWEKFKEKGGKYDWKKCKESVESIDPDCWKKEGEHVASFWETEGAKMKNYWTDFGHRMRDYWSNLFHNNNNSNIVSNATLPALPVDTTATAPPPANHEEQAAVVKKVTDTVVSSGNETVTKHHHHRDSTTVAP